MQKFTISETPVEILPGIWLSYVDGVLCVEKKKRREGEDPDPAQK